MKKMTLFFAFALVVSLLFAAGVREENPLTSVVVELTPAVQTITVQDPVVMELDDPSGREVANTGIQGVLEGTLRHMTDEW